MNAGESLVVPDLCHLQDGLHRDVPHDLLQGPRGAELGRDVEGSIAFVIRDVDRGASDEQLSHGVRLLQVCRQVQGSLWCEQNQ